MSVKKIIILAVVFAVVVMLAVFWFIGQNDRAQKSALNAKQAAMIIKKDQELKSLVGKLVSATNTLSGFDPADLPGNLSAKNLKITTDNATGTLRVYGLTIVSILRPFSQPRENEGRVMLRALDQQSELEAQNLLAFKKMYDAAATELVRVSVPKDLATVHLKLINSLRRMSSLLANMADVLRNPLTALQSAEYYRAQQSIFYASISEINSYLAYRGVKFSEAEKINIYNNFE